MHGKGKFLANKLAIHGHKIADFLRATSVPTFEYSTTKPTRILQ